MSVVEIKKRAVSEMIATVDRSSRRGCDDGGMHGVRCDADAWMGVMEEWS